MLWHKLSLQQAWREGRQGEELNGRHKAGKGRRQEGKGAGKEEGQRKVG